MVLQYQVCNFHDFKELKFQTKETLHIPGVFPYDS